MCFLCVCLWFFCVFLCVFCVFLCVFVCFALDTWELLVLFDVLVWLFPSFYIGFAMRASRLRYCLRAKSKQTTKP